MTTSSFLTALRAQAQLPLRFRSGRESVSPGYHLTEVKRVAYETMDCGGMTHRWSETQFELWVPDSAGHEPDRAPMIADKFLRIVSRVEAGLPLEPDATARIHASFGGGPAALHDIERVSVQEGSVLVELVPDRTRCKAAERRAASAGDACCATTTERGSACGRNSRPAEPAVACCA